MKYKLGESDDDLLGWSRVGFLQVIMWFGLDMA
jgi:hypothetical protein